MMNAVSKMDPAWPCKCHDMQGDPVFHVKWMHLVKLKITANFIGENFIGNTHLLGSTVLVLLYLWRKIYIYTYMTSHIYARKQVELITARYSSFYKNAKQ